MRERYRSILELMEGSGFRVQDWERTGNLKPETHSRPKPETRNPNPLEPLRLRASA
jgi:hypothetical protein